ncbi:MAG: PorP/SprF family type IX secretion system membrane protein [Bacteroidetes bacterium]|nr:PorP/SprF family type IX secretion system membrane protein [Bacteroidota bacterium]
MIDSKTYLVVCKEYTRLRIRYLLLCTLYFILATDCYSQDIHFSQFSQSPLQINPAMTGFYDGYHRGIMNYKNQWAAMGNAFKTISASYDMPLVFNKNRKKSYLGAGVSFFKDKAGDSQLGISQVNLSVSGIVPINVNHKFSAGLQAGFAQRSIDASKLTWQSQFDGFQFDPNLVSHELQGSTSFSYLDVGAGTFYEFSNKESSIEADDFFRVNAGVAMFHVNQPKQKFSSNNEKLNSKLLFFASAHYDIPETKYTVLPNVLFMKQGGITQLNIGTSAKYKVKEGTKITGLYSESAIGLGLNYRLKDAVIPQVFYELGSYFISLSYDFNLSTYRNVSAGRGGFEITLRYTTLKNALRK